MFIYIILRFFFSIVLAFSLFSIIIFVINDVSTSFEEFSDGLFVGVHLFTYAFYIILSIFSWLIIAYCSKRIKQKKALEKEFMDYLKKRNKE